MIFFNEASSAGPVWVAGAGLLGLILSPLAELLISRLLPRVGPMPGLSARITTAAITAALCAAFAFRFSANPGLPAFLLLAVLGVQLARIDISLHLLPNPMVLSLLIGGLLFLLAATFGGEQLSSLVRALAGAAILFVAYLVLALISPSSLGMGDVKLAAPVGLYLGYLGWSQLLYGGLLGFILNGLVTALVVARNGKEHTAEVAHGPSMIGATVGIGLLFF
ncbi:prepilin peptidase [Arthrobacter sp. BE255]|uniref:prepilin peptidase n=1 Tax=Arthrobacter sp. BE255 TaxID=2817721 RepID=UPI002856C27B|nr:prepilin peptidase [Arthrobacter sp. BE255]MDR7157533.1 leader peptidase (prepilin peptidase)/N-methyltransferase [Arthrobacter sp. BE255]